MILAGCSEMEWVEGEGGERVEELVEEYRFETHEIKDKIMYVYTPEQTFVWGASNIKFYETDDKDTKVKYTVGDNGNIWDREIYIGKGLVKDFSTEYAELFSATLRVIPMEGKGEAVVKEDKKLAEDVK